MKRRLFDWFQKISGSKPIAICGEDIPPKPLALIRWFWGRKVICVGVPSRLILRQCDHFNDLSARDATGAAILSMQQKLPFEASDLLLASSVDQHTQKMGRICVEVFVVPKEEVRTYCQALVRSGFEIANIHPLYEDGKPNYNIDFGSGSRLMKRGISESNVRHAALVLGALMLLAFLATAIWKDQQKIQTLRRSLNQQIEYINRFSDVRQKLAKQQKDAQDIRGWLGSQTSLSFLSKFYSVLPTGIGVQRLQLHDDQLNAWLLSDNSTDFVRKLKEIEAFKRVEVIGEPQSQGKQILTQIEVMF